jgi:hypothetical protein
MEHLIKKIIKEESEQSVFSPMEIRLFKFINKFKRELGTETKMYDFFENSMSTFNLPKSEANKYHLIYTLNYRPEGDYENVTKSNFKDPKKDKQRKTSNSDAGSYSQSKIAFKGSNLEGYWKMTRDNEWAYIIMSYGWYPIYVFKYNRWFEAERTYSSATGKQMRNTYPISYNSDLGQTTIKVSQDEMGRIINGYLKPEDLLTGRTDKFIVDMKKKQRSGETTTFRGGWNPRARIKFKISSVRKARNGYKIVVDVLDVDKFDNNKLDRESGNFFDGDIVGLDKNKVKEYLNDYFSQQTSQKFQGLNSKFYNIDVLFRGQI